jgi:hypothetical protein
LLSHIPLGTPYPDVVRRIVQVTEAKELGGESHLIVDATGVGRPVVDLLREERPPATLLPVLVSGAAQETTSDGFYLVPKRDLIVGLQLMFQQGRLPMARDLEHASDLVEELLGMETKATLAGRDVFGARHDDLVFAVALACWGLRRSSPHLLSGENPWWANRYEAAAEVFRKYMGEREKLP